MPLEEAGQAARAGLHGVLGQPVAEFVQEDLRMSLVGRQDQIGMRLDGSRAVVAPRRLGRDLSLLTVAL